MSGNRFFEQDLEPEYMTQEEADALEKQVMNAPSSQQTYAPINEEVFQEIQEEGFEVFSDEDLENDEELLNDVSLRLEQGRLYQMILNHDLFKDIDAPPKAIANVQREIRQHVRGRLAVLLGLKPDVQTPQKKQDFPFTDMEVNLLKTLLAKLSNGATDKYKEIPEEVVKENKIVSVTEKKPQTITPLSAPRQVQKIAVNKPIQKAPVKQQKPLPQNPNRIKSRIDQIKELEAELSATSKPIQEMSHAEIEARNIKISKLEGLKKTPRPANAVPMPSLDVANSVYANMSHTTTQSMLTGPMGKAMSGK